MPFILNFFIIFYFFRIYNCLNQFNNIFIPFRTKNLRIDYENENYEYINNSRKSLNASSFLNKWFYNGIYFNIKIGNPTQQLQTFLNFDNSNLSIEKCGNNIDNLDYSLSKERLFSSKTLKINEIKNNEYISTYILCNDYFSFYDTSNYFSNLYINEKYNGLNFLYNNNDNKEKLCGNLGLNLNNNEDTNFIEQLKKKNIISKYIWTLDYQTLSQGVIVIGSEPHFYDSNSNFFSQYKTIYSNLNKNKNSWSILFDKINIEGTNIYLKNRNVELCIDHGLIIGTEEYKNIIEQSFFNELINENICFKKTEKLLSKDYIIFFCDKIKFKGDFSSYSYNKKKNSMNLILYFYIIKNWNIYLQLEKKNYLKK